MTVQPGPATHVVAEFYNICTEARSDFDLYRTLFEEDEKITEMCVEFAPFFFNDFNRLIVRQLVLQICRITDPATTGKHENLTTNYIVEQLTWPATIRDQLDQLNQPLMAFRKKVEPARSKRIAHTDLHNQVFQPAPLGQFNKGEDAQFFIELQSFYDVAHRHVFESTAPPIALAGSTDTHKVIRAVVKATLYDRCPRCTSAERANDVLDFDRDLKNIP